MKSLNQPFSSILLILIILKTLNIRNLFKEYNHLNTLQEKIFDEGFDFKTITIK